MGNKAKNRFEYQKDGSVKIWLNGKNGAGKYTLVDAEDFEGLELWKYSWNLLSTQYVRACISNRSQRLHRLILGVSNPKVQIDHINHNTLDNRKSELRIVTNSQNHQNRKSYKDTTSQYKGVSWHKPGEKWRSGIKVERVIHLGYFTNEIDAAKAYDRAAQKYFGEFALLNFP